MASEASTTKAAAKLIRRRGGWVVKFHGTKATRVGVPDHLICYRGQFVAMEMKAPGGEATPIQAHEIQKIIAAGGRADVVDSVEKAEAILDAIDAELDGT